MADTRVLVVDDEANITDLVATALRYEGFDVEVASTGSDALKAAAAFRPDLMVLDIMLPDRDGFAVVQRLRADGLHVPVVFLTARDSTEEKVKGLTVGGDDYVTKPFSLEELVARVRAVLRRTGAVNGDGTARLVFADLELDDDTHEVWRGRTRGARSRSRRSSTTFGSTTSTATPTSWRRTSATSARRSTSSDHR